MPAPDARLLTALQYQQARQYPAAEQIYRHVLSHQPNDTDAARLLGILLTDTGRPDEAVDVLRRGIAVSQRPVELRRALVNALVAVDDVPAAVEQAREVLRVAPGTGDPLLVLAQLLARAGDPVGAEVNARLALELMPQSVAAWVVLARAFAATARPADAVTAYDHALSLAPAFADAVVERAYVLQVNGRPADAVAGYEAALRLVPNQPAVLANAAACLLQLGRHTEATHAFEAAARLEPDRSGPRTGVGLALLAAGRVDDALPQFAAAARLDPADPLPVANTGTCHAAVGEHRRAVDAFRAAEAIRPSDVPAGNALLSLVAADDSTADEIAAAHVAWGERYADPAVVITPTITDADLHRRLRVGYVSPDLHDGPVRHFIEPVLAAHDKAIVEVFCYATGGPADEVTDRLRKHADGWHDIAALDGQQTADLIRSHAVDVLVDLAGHRPGNRLVAFAARPAPVQVTWLGHPATVGVPAIDYRLTDAVADPPGVDPLYTEQLIRLPGPFAVYADDPAKPYDPTLPADRRGHVTFGAFNTFAKVNGATLTRWATAMAVVPHSRLLFVAGPLANPSTRAAVVAAFAAAGVSADRLDLRTTVPAAERTALLGEVDLMLDTFPYAGHATTLEALWMGAPTVSLYGHEFRGRLGLSVHTHLGTAETFAVSTPEQFVRQAVELATDLTRLRELRPTWRERLRASPLCDATTFSRGLESAYRQAWVSDRAFA